MTNGSTTPPLASGVGSDERVDDPPAPDRPNDPETGTPYRRNSVGDAHNRDDSRPPDHLVPRPLDDVPVRPHQDLGRLDRDVPRVLPDDPKESPPGVDDVEDPLPRRPGCGEGGAGGQDEDRRRVDVDRGGVAPDPDPREGPPGVRVGRGGRGRPAAGYDEEDERRPARRRVAPPHELASDLGRDPGEARQ
ncbi:hypothetical protein THAOC_14126, partial [Thalassiosira oceanica]